MISTSHTDLGFRMRSAGAGVWSVAFRVAGRVRRPSPRQWSTGGHQRVMIIAPHPDDEIVGCGGTAMLHSQQRDVVRVVHVTDGRRSRALGLEPSEMASRRRLEAAASCQKLGVHDSEWLGLPEGDWHVKELAGRLRELLGSFDPHVIYAPSSIDFHPEHVRVAAGVARSLTARGGVHRVRVFQVQVPLTDILTNVVAGIEAVRPRLEEAAAEYVTQNATLRGTWRIKRYAARYHGLSGHAEEFWEMTPDQYVAVQGVARPEWGIRFRGLRQHALPDPLAYLRARRERRLAKRAAAGAARFE